jgi:L-fucose mutarotase/ribose pyranase (RbsD/FucU family)
MILDGIARVLSFSDQVDRIVMLRKLAFYSGQHKSYCTCTSTGLLRVGCLLDEKGVGPFESAELVLKGYFV